MPARVYQPTPANLRRLAAALQRGELVAVPSETVYGLAADALDARAVAAVFTAKGRPAHDPLIVHLPAWRDVSRVAVPSASAERLARAFWPGPLTLVLPKRPEVPDIVTSGRPSVAVRVPRHPVFRQLLRACGRPLAAPSANPFGYVSPTTAEHVRAGLGHAIRHILDGGPCPIGVESTVLDLRDPRRPVLLRPGAIGAGELEAVLGVRVRRLRPPAKPAAASIARRDGDLAAGGDSAAVPPEAAQLAPGLLDRHYSPRTPLRLHRRITAAQLRASPADEAWLLRARPAASGLRRANVFWLDAAGEARGAARQLFGQLRALDDGRWRVVHAELFPARSGGVAEAINDRLTRAAKR